MARNHPVLDPSIRNLIREGSVFRQDAMKVIRRTAVEDDIDVTVTSAETNSQTMLGKLQGGLSKLALGDTVKQPEI